ncbi:putative ribonucleoside diphosphage reductase 1, beta subunit, B2 [Escherichia coli 3-267-03_S1_C2]|nr:putative ribonucleoside diphosphage reductase 1, beta subunit, B2 [Escherichia coli 3-267-03_S1_C2]
MSHQALIAGCGVNALSGLRNRGQFQASDTILHIKRIRHTPQPPQ